MKKKIFSIILSVCMFFSGLFAFSGCSLFATDKEKVNSVVVMKIGNTDVTKLDLINAFYTYYQNNSSYFSYYDSNTIEESFYTWFKVKTLIDELSADALGDYIFYTNEDADTVWKNIEDYFYSQVSTAEKALYEADGVDKEDYPVWLQDAQDDDETKHFEPYKSAVSDVVLEDRQPNAVDKLTSEQVFAKVAGIQENLFKYVVSTDDEGNETKADIAAEYLQKRNQAYANYIQSLISSAKASGTSTDRDVVLKNEVLRVYEAYYKSQVSVIFQNYYVQNYLLNYNNEGDKNTLNDSAVVSAFLDQYYKDMQTNQIGSKYVSTMTSSDGASLVLYHYQGKYYYFSVQHILIKFSEYLEEQVKQIPGYSTDDTNQVISEPYTQERDALVASKTQAMLSEIKTDSEKDSILTFGNYYYYDKDKKDVWDTVNKIYYGYVQLSTYDYDDVEKEITYHYTNYETADGTTITYESNGVKRMATLQDVLAAYEKNYNIWFNLAEQVYDASAVQVDETIESLTTANENKYETIEYVLQVAKDMRKNGLSKDALKEKVSSLLFIELEWIYSADSLDNNISNKIGYIISSQPNDNGSWVVDFAVGAREAMEDYSALSTDGKVAYTNTIISNYGYHIIKIGDVYDATHLSAIDWSTITADYSLANDSEYVSQIISALNKTYVCSGSNETLYNYFYDAAYTNLVGSSSSAGSYFLSLEYGWLNQYYEDKKIEVITKLTYDELLAAIA